MIKINLLSEGKRTVRKARPTGAALKGLEGKDIGQWLLVAGLLVGVGALALNWWLLNKQVEEKTAEVAAAQREVEALAGVIKEVEDYKAKKSELERKIGVINDLKANQRGPVRVMDYISRALPELLWLDRLKMTPDSIEVEGRAFNTNAVANFIENLDKVPEFDEPVLKSTEQQAGTPQTPGIYKFVVNFHYSFATHAKDKDGDKNGGAGKPGSTGPAKPKASIPATSG
ncbi:MAG TPA: PilN domain-containing protein [Thermoanaerobaculia bacterium]|jgi:type IV pilus assembly protein PilN|nr:PilN domain-containing protein [Thermoanaerobaculia bacterium]